MVALTHDLFRAGDTFKLLFDLDDYPAGDGWALDYILAGATNQTIAATVVDGEFQVLADTATTAAWTAGNYTAFAQVSKDGETFTIELGSMRLLGALADGYDGRSHVKKTLDALEALIEGKASKDVDSYSIAGRQLTKMKPDELLKWLNQYRQLYRAELAALSVKQGKRAGNLI